MKKSTRLGHLSATGLATILFLLSGQGAANTFSINITVDENGNGSLSNTNGFLSPLQSGLLSDPGPGGLANTLTYNLLNPPGLTQGDVWLNETGGISDLIRFNASESCFSSTGCLVFYSNPIGGFDSLADTASFPGANYSNVITIQEVAGQTSYTPTSGQAGFVSGAGGQVTYNFISDISNVPEPATLALITIGLAGIGFGGRRKIS